MARKPPTKASPATSAVRTIPIEVPYARLYTRNQPVHICGSCGFVYVRSRRSSEEIARVWNEELYGTVYTAKKHPAMLPRYTYIAGFMESHFDIGSKKVCDIGAGEGLFLKYLKDNHDIVPFGIEPSPPIAARSSNSESNPSSARSSSSARAEEREYRADVATILWTLENCLSCLDMLEGAAAILPVGGRIVVATGSRILVPFKKPLFYYLSNAARGRTLLSIQRERAANRARQGGIQDGRYQSIPGQRRAVRARRKGRRRLVHSAEERSTARGHVVFRALAPRHASLPPRVEKMTQPGGRRSSGPHPSCERRLMRHDGQP